MTTTPKGATMLDIREDGSTELGEDAEFIRKESRKDIQSEKFSQNFPAEDSILTECHRVDFILSNYIFTLSLGQLEYFILTGACIFGHKGMPLTIMLSSYFIGFGGMLFMALCSVFTVLTSTLGKHSIGRLRPDPSLLSDRIFNIRSNFNNPAFPSGDTAQAAVFGTVMFLLLRSPFVLLSIPWAAFGRVYYGCHWVFDTCAGAFVGSLISFLCYSVAPGSLVDMDFPTSAVRFMGDG